MRSVRACLAFCRSRQQPAQPLLVCLPPGVEAIDAFPGAKGRSPPVMADQPEPSTTHRTAPSVFGAMRAYSAFSPPLADPRAATSCPHVKSGTVSAKCGCIFGHRAHELGSLCALVAKRYARSRCVARLIGDCSQVLISNDAMSSAGETKSCADAYNAGVFRRIPPRGSSIPLYPRVQFRRGRLRRGDV